MIDSCKLVFCQPLDIELLSRTGSERCGRVHVTPDFRYSLITVPVMQFSKVSTGSHMDSITGQCPREARVGGVGPLLASTAPPSSYGSDGTSVSRRRWPSLARP